MSTNIGIPFHSILDLIFLAIRQYLLAKESDFLCIYYVIHIFRRFSEWVRAPIYDWPEIHLTSLTLWVSEYENKPQNQK
jgi:hypothetical protein